MREWEFRLLEEGTPLDELMVAGQAVRKGDRVRLKPAGGGDAFDLMLAGQTAMVESIEQDYESRVHVAVVLDEDPGRDVGFMKQPGHRFFFAPEELEPLSPEEARRRPKRILVAGIGNIFHGDDAFGVEVAQRLVGRRLPPGVRVVDFGIRSFDLAYALTSGYDLTILVDACPRGDPPGTLYVVEPNLEELMPTEERPAMVETHGMKPTDVLRLAQRLGGPLSPILVVGCEPGSLGPVEGRMGLSEAVAGALGRAEELVESLIQKFLGGEEETPRSLS